ncbi:MAG: metallophosphoesterase [Candidatus Hermodarchaeota archaeon]
MRILVITDSHGRLHLINDLVAQHNVDIVLHCGDLQFISVEKIEQMPSRELSLSIRHSNLPEQIRKRAWKMDRDEKTTLIRKHQLFGEFDLYLQGKHHFDVPVYIIWGNHEDSRVVYDLLTGKFRVPNLNLLTATSDVVLDNWIRLAGIGGNILYQRFFDKQSTDTYYPFMNFLQWIQLYEKRAKERHLDEHLWLLTHVSPGKEPLLEIFSMHIQPDLWFSGHMGAPLPQHYSLFTFNDDYDFARRSEINLAFFKQLWKERSKYWVLWYKAQDLIQSPEQTYETPKNILTYLQPLMQSQKNPNHILTLKGMKDAETTHELARQIIPLFKKGKLGFPHVSFIPTKQEIKCMHDFLFLLDHPYDVPQHASHPERVMERQPARWVKKTQFFNLPDVNINSYILIDANPDTRELEFRFFGKLKYKSNKNT